MNKGILDKASCIGCAWVLFLAPKRILRGGEAVWASAAYLASDQLLQQRLGWLACVQLWDIALRCRVVDAGMKPGQMLCLSKDGDVWRVCHLERPPPRKALPANAKGRTKSRPLGSTQGPNASGGRRRCTRNEVEYRRHRNRHKVRQDSRHHLSCLCR